MSRELMPLVDILLAANRAMEFKKGYDADRFKSDTRTQWAVYGQTVVIGEAAGRIDREFQLSHPEIPWSDMIGMRHRLIHGYDDIKWDRVWDTVITHLPRLKAAIEPLIPSDTGN